MYVSDLNVSLHTFLRNGTCILRALPVQDCLGKVLAKVRKKTYVIYGRHYYKMTCLVNTLI